MTRTADSRRTRRIARGLRRSALPAITVASAIITVGSVAWAAGLPRNSVGTTQLKANAVTSAKIKPGGVTLSDLANNSVNGAKVNEASLGKVPSAASADLATSAASATTAATAATATSASTVETSTTFSRKVAATAVAAIDNANLEATPDTVLYTQGSLSLRGDCISAGGTVMALLHVHTTQDGAALYTFGPGSTLPISDGSSYLNAATVPLNRYVSMSTAAGNTAQLTSPSAFVSLGADGGTIAGTVSTVAKQGTLPVSPGNGFMGTGNSCLFVGSLGRAPMS